MKIVLRSVAVGLLGLLVTQLAALGADPAEVKLVKLDLSKAGEIDNGEGMKGPWKLSIQGPEGARLDRVGIAGMTGHNGQGVLVTESGSGFGLAIYAVKANPIADKKKEWAKDGKTKKLVIDEEDTLMREITSLFDPKKPAYQFLKYKKVGDRGYVLEGGGTFGKDKAIADLELKCANTLTAEK